MTEEKQLTLAVGCGSVLERKMVVKKINMIPVLLYSVLMEHWYLQFVASLEEEGNSCNVGFYLNVVALDVLLLSTFL